nr:MAG TPA: hypothetical protein [Caudoviricetes sp.]
MLTRFCKTKLVRLFSLLHAYSRYRGMERQNTPYSYSIRYQSASVKIFFLTQTIS